MKSLLNKPYLIFWISIPLILLIGFVGSTEDLVVNFHDAYYVISLLELNILVSTLFAIIGFVYWILAKANKTISRWLVLIHLIITFGGVLLIFILSQFHRQPMMDVAFK